MAERCSRRPATPGGATLQTTLRESARSRGRRHASYRLRTNGFRLHAVVRVEVHDRKRLEQLCCYVTRPALSDEQVQLNAAGRVKHKLKTPWRDGTTHLVMTQRRSMQRLAALVLRPAALRRPNQSIECLERVETRPLYLQVGGMPAVARPGPPRCGHSSSAVPAASCSCSRLSGQGSYDSSDQRPDFRDARSLSGRYPQAPIFPRSTLFNSKALVAAGKSFQWRSVSAPSSE